MTIQPTQRAISLAAFLAAVFGSACGSGGGTPISLCNLDSFMPNYARSVSHLLTWNSFPLRVRFIHDAEYTIAKEELARSAFDSWYSATGTLVSYLPSTDTASEISVRFDSNTANGLTELHFDGLVMSTADIVIGTKSLSDTDINVIAKHEFGHALGIEGHSPLSTDLMYPVHVIDTSAPISERDLNTLKTGYCHLFGRCEDCTIDQPNIRLLPEEGSRMRIE